MGCCQSQPTPIIVQSPPQQKSDFVEDIVQSVEFLHFNDVYQIEPTRDQDPVGGVARFRTLIDQQRQRAAANSRPEPLLLFSGDAFSPSTHSTITKGKHMVPVLNSLGIAVSCIGNHDFDFGFSTAQQLISSTNFPWLLSNVLDKVSQAPLVGCQTHLVLQHNGLKIGFMGLAEREWIDTLSSVPDTGLLYLDFIAEGNRLANLMREQHQCDLIIALTHMRQPNDNRCGELLEFVDLVLGGHDHEYYCTVTPVVGDPALRGPNVQVMGGRMVLKSGSDFRHLSRISIKIRWSAQPPAEGWDQQEGINSSNFENKPLGPWLSEWWCHYPSRADGRTWRGVRIHVDRIDTNKSVEVDGASQEMVVGLTRDIDAAMDKLVAYTTVPLDARFESARTRECNIGNFVADVLRLTYEADFALLCGGAIRSNNVYDAGPVPLRTILLCFPFQDPTVLIRISGKRLWEALENGVYSVPKQDGRFCHMSGLRLVYDPELPPGKRLVSVDAFHPLFRHRSAFAPYSQYTDDEDTMRAKINRYLVQYPDRELSTYLGQTGYWFPLDLDCKYVVATRCYMWMGRDGYDALNDSEVLMDEEHGHLISALLRRFFTELRVATWWRHLTRFKRVRGRRIERMVRHAAARALLKLSNPRHVRAAELMEEKFEHEQHDQSVEWTDVTLSDTDAQREIALDALHKQMACISPRIEGRILTVAQAAVNQMTEL